MSFRVTPNFLASQLVFYNRVHTANLGKLQYQASTGLRISRPSEDPSAVQKLFGLKRTLASLDTDNANIQTAQHTLNNSVSQLTEAHNMIRAAQRIALDARQADPSSLEILAIEVDRLKERLIEIANATENGRYLYGGQSDQTAPYVPNGGSGTFPPYTYQGSTHALTINVSLNIQVDTLYDGQQIFGTTDRQTSFYIGETGAQPGAGIDNAISRGRLTVTHESTSYVGGSGLAAGTNSIAGDTIVGTLGTHTVELIDVSGTGSSGTISLNGGNPIAWNSADTGLQVQGPKGETIFVDTTSITAGFNGTVDIALTGRLSTDDGLTTIPIDYTTNQVVTDSNSGKVTNVDTSQLLQTGVEEIDYRGSSDIISALTELAEDLRGTRNLTSTQFHESMIRRDEDISRHAESVLRTIGEQSVSLEALVSLEARNRVYSLEVATVADDIESADLSEVVVKLQQEQNLLEYTYAVSSTILAQNILDFLR